MYVVQSLNKHEAGRGLCVNKPQFDIYKGRGRGELREKSLKRRAWDWANSGYAGTWPSAVARHTSMNPWRWEDLQLQRGCLGPHRPAVRDIPDQDP